MLIGTGIGQGCGQALRTGCGEAVELKDKKLSKNDKKLLTNVFSGAIVRSSDIDKR